jgi:hypothetical protein
LAVFLEEDMAQTFPTGEPTSALNYSTLLTQAAYALGVAYYGPNGNGAPQPPIDTFNLAICSNIVNDALRMLITDGPEPSGWYWQNQIAQVDLWPEIGPDPTGSTYVSSTTYNSTTNWTTLQLTTPAYPPSTVGSTQSPSLWIPNFVQSMEMRNIWLGGQPSTGTPGWFVPSSSPLYSTSTIGIPFTIVNYLGPFTIQVEGNVAASSTRLSTGNNMPFAFAATGDYTLPANFGGAYTSEITWIANTNRGVVVDWVDEAAIRQQRQVYAQQFGTPYWFAVRPIPLPSIAQLSITPNRPRWELMSFRITSEFLSVNFAYFLSFNNLVNSSDEAPVPLAFDEVVKAAVLAQAEFYQMDSIGGPRWAYYRGVALPNAKKLNMMSAPKKLGYCGNPTRNYGPGGLVDWRRNWYLRPNVAPPGSM